MTILGILGFLNITLVDILDIVLVALIIYLLFRWIKGSSAMNIFVAIILLLIIRIIAEAIGMKMISSLLGTIIDLGGVALLVIFQPEIRKFLNNIGKSAGSTIESRSILSRLLPRKPDQSISEASADEISQACISMSQSRTGALIVILGRNKPDDIISTGDTVDARISNRMIMNIFFKNSPLHDGAMVIGGDRIIAARCTLPITERLDLPARYGMRHKAAFGLSEICDAHVLVVSEQTGEISYVHEGKVTVMTGRNVLKATLLRICGQEEQSAAETENNG